MLVPISPWSIPPSFLQLASPWNFSTFCWLHSPTIFTRQVFFRSSSIGSTLWKERDWTNVRRNLSLTMETQTEEKDGIRKCAFKVWERILNEWFFFVQCKRALKSSLRSRDFAPGLKYQLVGQQTPRCLNGDPEQWIRTWMLGEKRTRSLSVSLTRSVLRCLPSFPNNQIFPLLCLVAWKLRCSKKKEEKNSRDYFSKKMRSNLDNDRRIWGTFVIHHAAMRIDCYEARMRNKSLFYG